MLADFQRFLRTNRLWREGDRVLAGVSGGIDSMVLAHLLHQSGTLFAVAHLNHGLREEESDEDERFVRQWCETRGIKVFTHRIGPEDYGRWPGMSVQMAARELRYEWFRSLVDEHAFGVVATGHHMDDQTETVLMQFLHGRDVLTGIPVRNGPVVRPLLFAGRELIRTFALEQGIGWREDSSNLSDDYLRNELRHQIIPMLLRINPRMNEAVQRLTFGMRGRLEIARAGRPAFRERFVSEDSTSGFHIDIAAVMQSAVPAEILYQLLAEHGFTISQCADAIEGIDGGAGRLFRTAAAEMVQDRGQMVVRFVTSDEHGEVLIEGPGSYRLGPWLLECTWQPGIPSDMRQAALNPSAVEFPLVWRRWQEGDSFVPLGMTGHKKVSDYLVDAKVPRTDKSSVTVVTCGGVIAWLAGHRLAHDFRLFDSGALAFRMELRRAED